MAALIRDENVDVGTSAESDAADFANLAAIGQEDQLRGGGLRGEAGLASRMIETDATLTVAETRKDDRRKRYHRAHEEEEERKLASARYRADHIPQVRDRLAPRKAAVS